MSLLRFIFGKKTEQEIQKNIGIQIDGLHSQHYTTREKAERKLIKIGKPAVGPIIDALMVKKDSDRRFRGLATSILGEIRDKRALECLIYMLEDSELASEASDALRKLHDPLCVEPLIRLLNKTHISGHDGESVLLSSLGKAVIVRALASFRDERAIDSFVAVLINTNDMYVRTRAAAALGEVGIETTIAALEAALVFDKVWFDEIIGEARGDVSCDVSGLIKEHDNFLSTVKKSIKKIQKRTKK